MKALSIRQPWAWLIVNGFKDVENRSWKTHLRGWLFIHTGKTFDKEGYEWVKETFPEIELPMESEFEMGGVVGLAELVGCKLEYDSPWKEEGSYGFIFKGAGKCEFIPYKGQLNFFEVVQ